MVIRDVCPTVPSHLQSQLEPKCARSNESGGPEPLALLHPPLRLVTETDTRGGRPQWRPLGKIIIALSRRVFNSWTQQCPSCANGTRCFYCGTCVTTAGEAAGCGGCARAQLVVTVHSTQHSTCNATVKSILVSQTRGALRLQRREREETAAGALPSALPDRQ